MAGGSKSWPPQARASSVSKRILKGDLLGENAAIIASVFFLNSSVVSVSESNHGGSDSVACL